MIKVPCLCVSFVNTSIDDFENTDVRVAMLPVEQEKRLKGMVKKTVINRSKHDLDRAAEKLEEFVDKTELFGSGVEVVKIITVNSYYGSYVKKTWIEQGVDGFNQKEQRWAKE